jgi:hypothetical protein
MLRTQIVAALDSRAAPQSSIREAVCDCGDARRHKPALECRSQILAIWAQKVTDRSAQISAQTPKGASHLVFFNGSHSSFSAPILFKYERQPGYDKAIAAFSMVGPPIAAMNRSSYLLFPEKDGPNLTAHEKASAVSEKLDP